MLRALYVLVGLALVAAWPLASYYLVPNGQIPDFKSTVGGIEFTYGSLFGLGLGLLACALYKAGGKAITFGNVIGPLLCSVIFGLVAPTAAEGAISVTAAVFFAFLVDWVFPPAPPAVNNPSPK